MVRRRRRDIYSSKGLVQGNEYRHCPPSSSFRYQTYDEPKRVDILQSSRQVRVEVNGVVLADTRNPRLLFETGLPVRTYIPKVDCKMDLWVPSDLKTECPYKVSRVYGHSDYFFQV